MCDNLTYRSVGAETLFRMITINNCSAGAKTMFWVALELLFAQLNPRDEPISYIRTHFKLTFIQPQQM